MLDNFLDQEWFQTESLVAYASASSAVDQNPATSCPWTSTNLPLLPSLARRSQLPVESFQFAFKWHRWLPALVVESGTVAIRPSLSGKLLRCWG